MTPPVTNLSLDNGLGEMWSTHAYIVVVILATFSILWPYAKLLMMLHVWLRPYPEGLRGRLIVFLDQVGKWSLTDNFVLFFLIAFLYVKWSGADVGASHGSVTLQILCMPAAEIHTFLAATIVSLVLGHILVAVHRSASGGFRRLASSSRGNQPLWTICWPTAPLVARRRAAVGGSLILIASAVLVVMSWLIPLARVELGGVVGAFLDVTDQPRALDHSLSTVVRQLSEQGNPWLSTVMVFFAGIVPGFALLTSLCLWVVPTHGKARCILFAGCQTLFAWSSLDCLAVALFGAVVGGEAYGIGRYIELIIYSGTVAPLCNALRSNVGLECLEVKLSLLPGAWVLAVTVVAVLAVGQALFTLVRLSCVRPACTGGTES